MKVNGKEYTFGEIIRLISWKENLGWAELARRSGVDPKNLQNVVGGSKSGRMGYYGFSRVVRSVGYDFEDIPKLCREYEEERKAAGDTG